MTAPNMSGAAGGAAAAAAAADKAKARFAPIYAALENHDYNLAMRHCEKKENVNHPQVKVRGWGLVRGWE